MENIILQCKKRHQMNSLSDEGMITAMLITRQYQLMSTATAQSSKVHSNRTVVLTFDKLFLDAHKFFFREQHGSSHLARRSYHTALERVQKREEGRRRG